MTTIAFWNRLSVRLALLLVLIVVILAVATFVLINRMLFEVNQQGFGELVSTADVRSVVIHLFAIFLLTLIGATVFSRTLLIEPIESLLEGTQKIADGELGVTLPVQANSELGALAITFNQMSQNLAVQTERLMQSNQALRASEQLLEQRVHERTGQIRALLELSNYTAVTMELEPLLEYILTKLATVVDFTEASIFVQHDAHRLKLLYYQGPADREALMQYCDMRDITQVAQVIHTRKALGIDNVGSEKDLSSKFLDFIASYVAGERLDMMSWLAMPLIVRDKVVGIMTLEHALPYQYDDTKNGIAMAFASQVGVALENIRLYAEAQESAALEERRHLARELHDSVSQALFGITLGIDTALKQSKNNPDKLAEPLDYVKNLAQAALAEMRALIFELRPESLEQEGLRIAISKQAEALRARHQINIVMDAKEEPELSFRMKQALYRVSQEALHNITKHAKATDVNISLQDVGQDVVLSISDNGKGFDLDGDFSKNLGLTSMRERIEALGGRFRITTVLGQGTSINVIVPKYYREGLESATLSIQEKGLDDSHNAPINSEVLNHKSQLETL